MKKIIFLSIALLLASIGFVYGTEYSETSKIIDNQPVFSSGLTWTLYEDGILVVSGEGSIPDYDPFFYILPWWNYKSDIKKIIIEDGTINIGGLAFYQCTNLTDIIIQNSVISIREGAFSDCINLINISIGNSLETIEKSAFYSCTSLTEVQLPTALKNIDIGMFSYCEKLTSLSISEENPYYTTIDGVLYNKDVSKLLVYPAGKTGEYIFPESVTSIKEYGFHTCVGLTSITIPDRITSIEDFTFSACFNLKEVYIPNSVTKLGEGVFTRCKSLETIVLPSSITQYNWALFNLSGIKYFTYPPTATVIPAYTFYKCDSLTSIALPPSISTIYTETFLACNNLTSLLIDRDTPPFVDGAAFTDVVDLKNITIYVPAGQSANYTAAPWYRFKATVEVDIDTLYNVTEKNVLSPVLGETKKIPVATGDLFNEMGLYCQLNVPEKSADWLTAELNGNNEITITTTINRTRESRSDTIKVWLVSERNYQEIVVAQEYDDQAPVLINPTNDSVNILISDSVKLIFDEAVKFLDKSGILLEKLSEGDVRTNVSHLLDTLILENESIIAAFTENLDYSTQYVLTIPAGAIADTISDENATALPIIILIFTENENENENETQTKDVFSENIRVIGLTSAILVEGAAGKQASIFNLLGNLVYQNIIENNNKEIKVSNGLYVVKIENKIVKVLVK